jgi:uncharacterized protein YndB with AHSA1/START domain
VAAGEGTLVMAGAEKLSVAPEGDLEIVIARAFDAPRELIFEALGEPALLKLWLLGPPGWAMTECEMERKANGSYRWAWRHPDGQDMEIHGVIREWAPPARYVSTQVMKGMKCETLVTHELFERKGKTTLTMTIRYPSVQARDAALKSGTEHGVAASYDRLDHVLRSRESVWPT